LIDFLAFLVPNYGQKTPNLVRILYGISKDSPNQSSRSLAIILEPETLESPSNPIKTRIIA